MQARSIGYLCLALAMTSVGSTVVASRLAGDGLPPFTATSLRFLIAFPLLLLLMRVSGAGFPRLGMRDLALLLVQAGAGSTGYTVLLILGTRLTPAADAGVMLGTLPAMSTLLAALVLNEKLSSRDWFAALLATAGAMVIALRRGDTTLSAGALAGNALVLLAVACEALYILLNKRLRVPLAPPQLTRPRSLRSPTTPSCRPSSVSCSGMPGRPAPPARRPRCSRPSRRSRPCCFRL